MSMARRNRNSLRQIVDGGLLLLQNVPFVRFVTLSYKNRSYLHLPKTKMNRFKKSVHCIKFIQMCQKGAVAKWKFCSGPFFRPKSRKKPRICGKPATNLSVFA